MDPFGRTDDEELADIVRQLLCGDFRITMWEVGGQTGEVEFKSKVRLTEEQFSALQRAHAEAIEARGRALQANRPPY